MARPMTDKIRSALDRLVAHVSQLQPGERFGSNRAIARQYDVSYQTADRLLRQLEERGLLVRRPGSGSFAPGEAPKLTGVQLVFHARARRRDSFGNRLLALLRARLEREGVDVRVSYVQPGRREYALPRRDRLPVVWDLPEVVREIAARGGQALLLNDRPEPGLAAVRIDSVSVDDFSGGAAAAQLLHRGAMGPQPRFAVLAGPEGDARSDVRVTGFLSLARAGVTHSPTWFADDAKPAAAAVLRAEADGIFCCNDRLAEAVLTVAAGRGVSVPPIVGFDDAPIAARLNLTTIAVPWTELVEGAARIIRARLRGDTSNASRQVFAVSPVIRGSTPIARG
jgi:transposase